MEEDDDFGDLYTDVLSVNPVPTLLSPNQKPPPAPPTPPAVTTATSGMDSGFIEDDVEDANNINRSSLLAAPVPESTSIDRERQGSDDDADEDWLLGRDPLPVEEPVNWIEEEEDAMVERVSRVSFGGRFAIGGGARVLDEQDAEEVGMVSKEEMNALEEGGSIEKTPEIREPQDGPVIPGLSGALATSQVANGGFLKASDSDDWDSGSEDDLQIVLNDTGHDMRGIERGDGGGSDEDDEDLVIVTDDQHHHHLQAMEEQDWGDDGVQSSIDGEKKEMIDGAKTSGVTPTAAGAGLGYSSHGFHSQHHSMFKYVRPGATPAPRGATMMAAGALGQVRPPAFGPLAGRGRGDWRPAGGSGFLNMQKGFHSGYGLPTWGNSASGRPFGSGLDFFLPSHKTVFDVDIESFEEKPWRHPGVDISDFFNFGLDEENWKEYCKQVEQLRLESTMQSKIRVYESGRSEQEYDPDLPPELAAATGHNSISADNINLGKLENDPANLNDQGGANACMRPALPTGRAIQVESGYGERLPSIDTRAPRIRDSDAVIEIVLQDNLDDTRNSNGAFERPDNSFERENQKDFHNEDERPVESEFYGRYSRDSSIQLRESVALRIPISSEEDGILPLPSELSHSSNFSPKSRIPADNAKFFGPQHGGRLWQRTPSHGKISSASERMSETFPIQDVHLYKHEELQKEKSGDAMESNQEPELSPSNNCEIARESSTDPKDIEHDDRFTVGDSHDGDGEEASDFRLSSETGGEDGLINSSNRKKLSSCVEQYSAQDNGFGDDSRLTHSDNSRARSGNSRDYRKTNETGEEVMQVHPPKHTGELRKHPEEDERRRRDDYHRDGRREVIRNRSRGREILHDSASVHTFRSRAEGFEREMDDSVGGWRRREEDTRNRQVKDRNKVRITDRKEKIEEHGDWMGHGRDDAIRHRDRNEILMNRRENLEDGEMKRKRDVEPKRERADKEDSLHGYRVREDSHRRRRVRNDIVDHRKRDDEVRGKSNKHKDDNLYQKDREDRQQLILAHDDTPALQGREERRFTSRSKILAGSGRSKEDLKVAGPDKAYHDKDRRRHGEPSKRGDRTGEENESLNKARGDTHNREKRFSAEKRSMRNERVSARHDRPSGAFEEQQLQKERHHEGNRKVGESEPAGQKREASGKRKRGEHNSHRTELNSKGSGEQQSSRHSVAEGKKVNGNAGNPASDDESDDSRRGRSKLERWTSHKERGYSSVDNNVQPSSIIREVDDSREEINEPGKPDAARADSAETVADDSIHAAKSVGEDRDRHLDTVAKLKMRSERFKLPMPGEKERDFTGNRKAESEPPACIHNEAAASVASADADVKLERPARKRKWTGG